MESTPQPPRFFFPKEEKLCSKRIISYLFEHGHSFGMGVFKFFYVTDFPKEWMEVPVQTAFAVPKRSFRHAYMRNRLKRRMREAYRLHKHDLISSVEAQESRLAIFIKLNGRRELPYPPIEAGIKKGLRKMQRIIAEKNSAEA